MVDRARRIKCTEQQIVNAYAKLHSSNKVAEKLGIGQTTVLRTLMKQGVHADGLERYRAKARAFDPKTDRKIARQYAAGAWSADLAREYDVTIYAIKQALKRQGCPLRPNPAPTLKAGEEKKILWMHSRGVSQGRISIQIGRTQNFVSRVLRKNGITYQPRTRERHGSWKGGRHMAGGYWRVLLNHDDPMAMMANGGLYVLEHRLVMARHLARPLSPVESVHHINGDRTDNRLENLQLRNGKHGKGTVMKCLDCGSTNIGHAPISET